jgi:hypothetical protein
MNVVQVGHIVQEQALAECLFDWVILCPKLSPSLEKIDRSMLDDRCPNGCHQFVDCRQDERKDHQDFDGDAKHPGMVSNRVMRQQGRLAVVVLYDEQGSPQLLSPAVSVSPKSHLVS